MRVLAILVVLAFTPRLVDAANGPRWSPRELAEFADVVVTGTVTSMAAGWDHEVNAIYTFVTLDVSEVLKGDVAARRITIKQLGGTVGNMVLSITDQPAFHVGEAVLLYLEARPRDGTLYTSALWQGKWQLQQSWRGRSLAVRESPRGHAVAADSQALSDARSSAAMAAPSSADRVVTDVADVAVGTATLPRASAGFNLLGPYRYLHSPAVDVQAGGQPGLAGGGVSQVHAAIQRWNAAGSAFRFVVGGSATAARCSGQFLQNGRVTITFMDPCGEMSNTGGTLALGGSYFIPGQGGSSNGQTFDRAVEGFIVNNDSSTALSYLTNPGCFEDIQTHELGHVLGLNHSADSSAVMFATIDSAQCWNGARSLRVDDLQGVRFIYGESGALGSTPPTTAPTDLHVSAEASQLTVTWDDPSFDSPSAATSYRVDFRNGHQDGGAIVASVMQSGKSLTVGVPAGASGAFNVVVTGINAAGAGPSSSRLDFTLGGTSTTCSSPPAAPANLGGAISSGYARVHWSEASGATRYVIQAGSAVGGQDLFSPTDLGLSTTAGASVSAGFRAWIRVFAVNACGMSQPSDFLLQ